MTYFNDNISHPIHKKCLRNISFKTFKCTSAVHFFMFSRFLTEFQVPNLAVSKSVQKKLVRATAQPGASGDSMLNGLFTVLKQC